MLKYLKEGFFKCFYQDKERKTAKQEPKFHEIEHDQFDLSFGPDNSGSNNSTSRPSNSPSELN